MRVALGQKYEIMQNKTKKRKKKSSYPVNRATLKERINRYKYYLEDSVKYRPLLVARSRYKFQ